MIRRFCVLALLLVAASPALGQSRARRTIDQAREQIDNLGGDSAAVLLAAALRQNPTDAERLRAFTLLGIARLMQGDQTAAKQSFQQALRIDPTTRIDSLGDLQSDAVTIFSQLRAALDPERLAVRQAATMGVPPQMPVFHAADTTLALDDPAFVLTVQPNVTLRVVTTVTTDDITAQVQWADTQMVAPGRKDVVWSLRRPVGGYIAEGRYRVRMQAHDSSGQGAPAFERILVVARARVDTQPLPPPLPASSFAPETLKAGHGKVRVLLSGAALAALATATPLMFGNPTLNTGLSGDPTSYAVGGGVAIASVVAFVKGRQPARPDLDAISRNQKLRDDLKRRRDLIAASNQAARQRAPLQVKVEKAGGQ